MEVFIDNAFLVLAATLVIGAIIFVLCVIAWLVCMFEKEMREMGYDPIKKIKEMLK